MLKAYGKCTYLYLSGHRWTQVYTSGFEISGGGIFVLLISKAFIYKQLKTIKRWLYNLPLYDGRI